MVSAGHFDAEGIDCHSTAGSGCAGGTDHDFTDWVVPGTSARSPVEDWCINEYYSQRLVPEASSSWPPSLCAYYQ